MNNLNAQKNAIKIRPANSWGDTPLSVVLRMVARAEIFVLRAIVPLAALAGTFASLGLGALPLGAMVISGVVLSGKIRDICNDTASLLDIENLLSKQDSAAVRALIGKGTYLADKIKKYKTIGDMPPELQKEIHDYINMHYQSIRQLKSALYNVQVKAGKSLILQQASQKKYIPPSDRRLI